MNKQHQHILAVYQLIQEVEKLKTLLRHSWLSNNRQESVAEHTWRMAFMALLLAPHLDHPVDLSKTIKMILIHDVAEIEAGDYVAFQKQPLDKHALELKALKKLTKSLPKNTIRELISLWEEFETGETYESKFAIALDKLEVLIQHNQADIETWEEVEFDFNYHYADKQVSYDSTLTLIRGFILEDTFNKINRECK